MFFFPSVIMEWNKLEANIQDSTSCNVFEQVILKLIIPEPNQVFE